MKHKALLFLTALALVTTIGCKERQEIKNRNQEIFDYYHKEIQTFMLSDKIETFVGKEGTKITIDPNSLEIIGGKAISGNVEIQLIEYYQTEDIILANLSTSSDKNLIETGGMIKLSATANGQEVVVKNGKEFQIEFSSIEKKGMEIFHGETKDGQINWIPNSKLTQTDNASFFAFTQANNVNFFEQVDTVVSMAISIADSFVKNNILNSSKFGWINCDRFLELDNLTIVKIKYDTIFKPSAYLVFNEINSIMPCFYEKTYGKFINLPIGYEATLIAFCIDKEKTYFSSKKIIIENEMELNIEFEEVPLDKIKETIKKEVE